MNVISPQKIVSLEFIIGVIQNILFSTKFTELAKKKPSDFTRTRKMPLIPLTGLILNLVRCTTNIAIDRFFSIFPATIKLITQQAFSKARQNFRWQALRHLMDEANKAVYSGFFNTWHGYRVLAIDGTKIQLPADPKLKDIFGTIGRNDTAATAQASTLYDVLNKFIVDAIIDPISCGERTMAELHLQFLNNNALPGVKDLIIFDRGYPSFGLLEKCVAYGITFLMRVKSKFNRAIDAMSLGCHNYILCQGDKKIKLRVIKFKLPNGQVETLITNLFDYNLGTKAFKKLYFLRWSVEVKYGKVKHGLDIENFSSRTEEGIRQDFYATIILSNIITVGAWEAQYTIDENNKHKQLKHKYQVNINQAIGFFKNLFIPALFQSSPHLRSQSVSAIIARLVRAVIPLRPGRSRPRNPNPRVANFHHNQKSNC